MQPNLVVTTGCPWRRGGMLQKGFTGGELNITAVEKEKEKSESVN